jgi:hypothetical protein
MPDETVREVHSCRSQEIDGDSPPKSIDDWRARQTCGTHTKRMGPVPETVVILNRECWERRSRGYRSRNSSSTAPGCLVTSPHTSRCKEGQKAPPFWSYMVIGRALDAIRLFRPAVLGS